MPPEIKTYTFGHSFQVSDLNNNGQIDDGEIVSVADGKTLSCQDADAAFKRWGIERSLDSLAGRGLAVDGNRVRRNGTDDIPESRPWSNREIIDSLLQSLLHALSPGNTEMIQPKPMDLYGMRVYGS